MTVCMESSLTRPVVKRLKMNVLPYFSGGIIERRFVISSGGIKYVVPDRSAKVEMYFVVSAEG